MTTGETDGDRFRVAFLLAWRHYPLALSIRVACTPPLSVTERPPALEAHQGREIAQSIQRNTPRVVRALLHGTLAVRCPREDVMP